MQAIVNGLRSAAFRREAGQLPGYDASGAGDRAAVTDALAWLERAPARRRAL